MSFKQDKYSSKGDVDEFDLIAEKLAGDLRKSVRQLENFPILSDPWFEMADVFGRIANISDMESKLPQTKKDATLWETEEQALRFLLEDGKLNLCLRNLIEFKQSQINARKVGRGPMLDFTTECDKFEKGIGTMFRNAWQHVEVLQTTDLPLLINHIADTMKAALELTDLMDTLAAKGDLHQRQEVLVFYYLHGMMKHAEDIREHRMMPLIRERGLFMMAVRLLCYYGRLTGSSTLLSIHKRTAAEALSALVETEDFSTYRDRYYSASDVSELVELKELVLTPIMTDVSVRRQIRPLVDVVDRAKRASASSLRK